MVTHVLSHYNLEILEIWFFYLIMFNCFYFFPNQFRQIHAVNHNSFRLWIQTHTYTNCLVLLSYIHGKCWSKNLTITISNKRPSLSQKLDKRDIEFLSLYSFRLRTFVLWSKCLLVVRSAHLVAFVLFVCDDLMTQQPS